MIDRLATMLRSRLARILFLVVAVGAAVYFVMSQWDDVRAALLAIPGTTMLLAGVTGLVYVASTMLSWRAILADLGSSLGIREASSIFFVSQLGKYVPGGVWNVVAAAELGADAKIPRRRSLSVMVVAILVSIVTGLALAVVAIAFSPSAVAAKYWWVSFAFPVFLFALVPRLLNRLLNFALKTAKRPPLEHALSGGGIVRSSAWALFAWVVAGAHVWLLTTALGMEGSPRSFAFVVGGYALAWTVGFLVVFVPAGVGAREAVLAAVLYGQLDQGGVVATVLVSRVLLTLGDVTLGLAVLVTRRGRTSNPSAP